MFPSSFSIVLKTHLVISIHLVLVSIKYLHTDTVTQLQDKTQSTPKECHSEYDELDHLSKEVCVKDKVDSLSHVELQSLRVLWEREKTLVRADELTTTWILFCFVLDLSVVNLAQSYVPWRNNFLFLGFLFFL
jgi:hypothetical protein